MAITADDIRAHLHELLARAEKPPETVELGQEQLAAIEAEMRDVAGTSDTGPLVQFQGLRIVRSRKHNHVAILAAGERGEDEPIAEVAVTEPSGPDVEAVESGD